MTANDMDTVDCVVVGAGVVGLAIARHLARAGRDVIILEAANAIGTLTSSRNSEVIHAGVYYEPGSLKARLCVKGRRDLYVYCRDHHIPHRACGKLIVALDAEETTKLAKIKQRAEINGVGDLVELNQRQARELEPQLNCIAALYSPSTGIIDSHRYMLALRGDAEAAGAMLAFNAPLERASVRHGSMELQVGGAEPVTVSCRMLINAAGLSAAHVASTIDAMPRQKIPTMHYTKGNYFGCAVSAPFSRLIYPAPVSGGLGIHLTLDLAGQGRFGPDVEVLATIDVAALDYEVDPSRADQFYTAIRRYWPTLPDGALIPAYSGVRPKIGAPELPSQDFVVQGPADHGVAGLYNLFGIESPGLTSSLAVADHLAGLMCAEQR